MKRYKKVIALFFLISVIMICGCSSNNDIEDIGDAIKDPQNGENKIIENTKKDQVLNIHSGIIKNGNPLIGNNNLNAQVLNLIYDSLIEYDDVLAIKSSLAESWSVSNDGLTWTINLRDDVKWHDNEVFTSEDVEFTINMLMALGEDTKYNYVVQNISSFNVEDNKTFIIKLNQSQYNYIKLLNFPILPSHKLLGLSKDQYFEHEFPIIGTGPYVLDSFTDMKELSLVSNSNWWGGDSAKIKKINIKMIPDKGTVLDSLKVGEIDYALTDFVDWGKYASKGEYNISEFVTTYYDLLAFNFNNQFLSDINVRKAIGYAVSRDEIITKILLGHAVKVDSPIVPGSYLYLPLNLYKYDYLKAKEILSNSGWVDNNGDGVLEKEFEGEFRELSLKLITNNENFIREKALDVIAESLKKVGFSVIVEKYNWDEFNDKIISGNYDIALCGYNLMPTMDVSFAFHTEEIERGSNIFRYSNPELDELLKNVYFSKNVNEEKQIYENIQEKISEDLPCYSLYFRTSAVLYNKKLNGDIKPTNTDIFNNIENWYIE